MSVFSYVLIHTRTCTHTHTHTQEPLSSTSPMRPDITEPTNSASGPSTETPSSHPISTKLKSQLEASSTSSDLAASTASEPGPPAKVAHCDPVREDGEREDFAPAKKKFRHPGVVS